MNTLEANLQASKIYNHKWKNLLENSKKHITLVETYCCECCGSYMIHDQNYESLDKCKDRMSAAWCVEKKR